MASASTEVDALFCAAWEAFCDLERLHHLAGEITYSREFALQTAPPNATLESMEAALAAAKAAEGEAKEAMDAAHHRFLEADCARRAFYGFF